jgi:hypothetical protein
LYKRRVLQQQLIVLLAGQFDLSVKPLTGQRCLDDRLYARLDPVRQAMSNGLRPFIGLAAAGGEIAAVADQVRDELSDVIGKVDILGEAVDDLVDLRQGRAALESQVGGQG